MQLILGVFGVCDERELLPEGSFSFVSGKPHAEILVQRGMSRELYGDNRAVKHCTIGLSVSMGR